MKPFTLLRTKTHKKGFSHKGFRKRSSKWIFTKTEFFENAVDQCERTKTDKNKNAATATTKYFAHFSPKSTLNLKKTKLMRWDTLSFVSFPKQKRKKRISLKTEQCERSPSLLRRSS